MTVEQKVNQLKKKYPKWNGDDDGEDHPDIDAFGKELCETMSWYAIGL